MPSSPTPAPPPIFLLKTKSTPHDNYEEYFSSNNSTSYTYKYTPTFVPVLEHHFRTENLAKVRDLFVEGKIGEKYGGLIFTSQRAVEGFSRMVREDVGESIASAASKSLSLYAVGPATYRSLNTLRTTHLPHSTIHGEECGTGEKLAGVILAHYNSLHNTAQKQKRPLLFLIGETHRDIIPRTLTSALLPPEQRIDLDPLILYATDVMPGFQESFSKALVDARRERNNKDNPNPEAGKHEKMWVVVFSPTGCESMLRALDLISDTTTNNNNNNISDDGTVVARKQDDAEKRDCYIATIGPTTRDHLRERFGVEPDVCAEIPSPEGVGSGIEEFMRRGERGCVTA
ncbi:hypothetical protein AJ80_01741 [Polytolypa hystricis UAMH7299]|uniref:Tetrapyrrole biosynthesis uroporphyrinogen III synthase domain-containing protein n=1 Tax=Polytolypa hystricis (strain UAMH7299) TaxID=1447883 RepID=A0A2B7Z0K6_POLH7|nr:hypothetical protein AJ80_01741 [Polytolypa hystricis UAMH7299]